MDNQDLIPEMDFEPEELAKRVRQHRIAGVIIAVCLIVMGLLMVFMPFLGSVSINNTLATVCNDFINIHICLRTTSCLKDTQRKMAAKFSFYDFIRDF